MKSKSSELISILSSRHFSKDTLLKNEVKVSSSSFGMCWVDIETFSLSINDNYWMLLLEEFFRLVEQGTLAAMKP